MNQKLRLISFVSVCAMLMAFSLYKGHPLHGGCDKCHLFYHYR